ncbi:MAG: hypothetical protein L3J41_08450 [Melioribacteraceae bacterium]|nr:hypothetical protein [Melioribacteraceae bacterium]
MAAARIELEWQGEGENVPKDAYGKVGKISSINNEQLSISNEELKEKSGKKNTNFELNDVVVKVNLRN